MGTQTMLFNDKTVNSAKRSDSFIGRDDFLCGKVVTFDQDKILIFCGFFQVQFIFFAKKKANSTIEQQKCEVHEKYGQLLISKQDFIF